jgi:leader peptidase (prepilin peptidase) / N-methyltransferase
MTVHEIEAPPAADPFRYARDGVVIFLATFGAILCVLRIGVSGSGVVAAFVAFVLVHLAAIDYRDRVLPNRIVLPATAVVLVAHAAISPRQLPQYLLAALIAGGVFLLPAVIRPGALGMGDVKLAMMLGAALGTKVASALTLGLFAAGLVAIGLVAMRGRPALKSDIPLGPFLAFGALVVLLA